MTRGLRFALLLGALPPVATLAAAAPPGVVVQDPYLEFHSGPGRGYPVFHVVDRGESVALLRRRTDWIKVRAEDGLEGWVNREQLERTLSPTGDAVAVAGPVPSHLLGNFSNGWLATAGLAHVFVPAWRVSPFVGIGGGVVHIEPKSTLVQAEDRTDETAYAAVGLRGYLTNRFLLQAEYRGYVVFTSRNDNEEIEEWTVGFTYFF